MLCKVIQLTKKDLFQFNKSHFRRNLKRRIITSILMSLFFLCFLSGLIFYFLTQKDILLVISIIGFILLLLHSLIPYTYKLILHIVYRKDKFLKEELTYHISDEGIRIASKSATKMLPWDYIYNIHINKDYFIFYISKQKAFILPRRYLNKEETKHLLDYILHYIHDDKIDAS
ncbi:YcxB family protein [Vallitalea okinawensis]|uniref:YcxB family protein n=1 Tax=Vallitalea okinawensis TaxID=2078660 RepID=UPI000CFDA2DF|nr:YcxB family protein [Vallitalea okinawensis]